MATTYDFSGVWLSTYHKAGQKGAPKTDHYVTLRQIGNQLIVESMSGVGESYLLARFTLEDRVATGSYQSQNSPNNATKDALYYGASQLVLDEDGTAFRGMGVGFGADMKVKPTSWQIVRIGLQRADYPVPKSDEA